MEHLVMRIIATFLLGIGILVNWFYLVLSEGRTDGSLSLGSVFAIITIWII